MKRFLMLFAIGLAANMPARAQVVGGQSITQDLDFYSALVYTQIPFIGPACGATLIHPQWVITAGHCGLNPSTLQQLDSIDIVIAPYLRNNTSAYQRIRSEKIVVHPNWTFNPLNNDIALIKLRQPVNQGSYPQIPSQNDDSYNMPGAMAYVAGYGIYDTSNLQQRPDTLQSVEVEIIANSVCNSPSIYNGDILPTMLCAGKLNATATGAAAGDSGGPLFVHDGNNVILIGMVSFGNGAYSDGSSPGGFTKISAYSNWIDSVITGKYLAIDQIVSTADNPIISLYQNNLSIQFEKTLTLETQYCVYSIDGRTIQNGSLPVGTVKKAIPLHNISQGVYIVMLSDGKSLNYKAKLAVTN